MARLSKDDMAARGRFAFVQEEVELPEIPDADGKAGTVLVRSPSVGQRDEISRTTPDEPGDWTIEHTALVFATVVAEPKVTKEEAMAFLAEWPGSALDRVIAKFNELIGQKEELRAAAGEFRSSD